MVMTIIATVVIATIIMIITVLVATVSLKVTAKPYTSGPLAASKVPTERAGSDKLHRSQTWHLLQAVVRNAQDDEPRTSETLGFGV